MKRKHISLKTKLAAALCQMRHEVDGKWELILTHAEAAALGEDQVLSLFAWDHDPIPHAEGGLDVHWNLEPKLIAQHRTKTRTIDVPGIAKRKSVSKAHEAFKERILRPRDQREKPKSRMPSRPFPKARRNQKDTSKWQKRKMRP